MISMGIDVGSSSIKVSLFDTADGQVKGSGRYPDDEQQIQSPREGWAEQNPEVWWLNFKHAYKRALNTDAINPRKIGAIGISYQMHGLVMLDDAGKTLQQAIIWCDSRAVPYGEAAFRDLGKQATLKHLLNSPGNFTAAKLAWVKNKQPKIYANIAHWMLPGDYIAYRLSGVPTTTQTGLSEAILWDFKNHSISQSVLEYFDFNEEMIPDRVPAIGKQCTVASSIAKELSLKSNVEITYRAGDQPNNAFSLNVNAPGDVAATGGTSGVIYGVTSQNMYDKASRINTFLHVNDTKNAPRNGVLICINGTGILYRWLKKLLSTAGEKITYEMLNALAGKAPAGAGGLKFYPFGNGAERVLGNKEAGGHLSGIDFNRHQSEHVVRAGLEGIVYALMVGFDIMQGLDFRVNTIKAGCANLFLSQQFRLMFSNITQHPLEIYDTDGAAGAARGAALGYGVYNDIAEAFESLQRIERIEPEPKMMQKYADFYDRWKQTIPLSN